MHRLAALAAVALPLAFGLEMAAALSAADGRDARSEVSERPIVFGRVLDSAGNARATALVFAIDTERFLRRPSAVVTDDKGRFEFSELPPGRYVLLAIHGHHSPGRSDPVVVGDLGVPFPLKLVLGADAPML